jgi:hypothetical protein
MPANFLKTNLQAGGSTASSAVEGIKQRIAEQWASAHRKGKNDLAVPNDREEMGSANDINATDRIMPGQLIKNVLMKFNSFVIRETNFILDIFNFSEVESAHHFVSWQDNLNIVRTVPLDSKAQNKILYFLLMLIKVIHRQNYLMTCPIN